VSRTLTVLVVALAVAIGCKRDTRPSPPPRTGAVAADSPWTIVYDQAVGGNQDIYAVAASGGVPRRLTDDPAHDMLPRYTHDGRAVLFASDRGSGWQIWEVPMAGGSPRRVRSNAATEWQADESPDGRALAFLSNAEGAEYLFVMPKDGGAARALVRHAKDSILGNPDWSPDGRQITFSSNYRVGHQIYVADAQTGEARRISPIHRGGCEPRFSPDGRRVVYVDRGHLKETSHLVSVDVATGERATLVDWPALNYDPAWSPDGAEIAFASNITGEYAIYRQRLSDGKSWRVTHTRGDARYPDYPPR